METLFHFAQIRAPYRAAHQVEPLSLANGSPFQLNLAAAAGASDQRARQKALAAGFASSPAFVTGTGPHPVLDTLEQVGAAAAEVLAATPFDQPTLVARVVAVLGRPLAAALADPALAAGIRDIQDSVLAMKLLPPLHWLPIGRLVDALRVHALLERMGADPAFPPDDATARRVLRNTLTLPDWLRVAAAAGTRPRPRPSVRRRLNQIAQRYREVEAALRELRAIRPVGFVATAQLAIPGRLPPANMRPEALLRTELAVRQTALSATLLSAGTTIANPGGDLSNLAGGMPGTQTAAPALGLDQLAAATRLRVSPGATIAVRGRPAFDPAAAQPSMQLTAAVAGALTAPTQQVFTQLNLDVAAPLPGSVGALLAERKRLHDAAQALVLPLLPNAYRIVGGALVVAGSKQLGQVRLADPIRLQELLADLLAEPGPVPTSSADLYPAGVLDLLVVRQQLTGYEAVEVSQIENVMVGETRERTHRRRVESETIVFRESETSTESEDTSETVDRFETRRESQNALREQTSVAGSLTVSGSYGPSVEFQASGEASWTRNAEQSTAAASTVAREVTARATERISERLLTRETRRTTIEIEDTDRRGFDNVSGPGNVTGVYQFVSKIYQAQVLNYGQRTIYDLMLPEPGALLLEVFRRQRTAAVELVEPPEFTARPDDLTADKYQDFVVLYGATGVKPPPESFVVESYDFNTGGEDVDQEFSNSTRIQIPDGYQGFQASVGIAVTVWDDWGVDVVIGNKHHRFSDSNWIWITGLAEEKGSVPFAMTTDRVGDIALAVKVTCEATPRATALWQAETHALLVDAYRARRSEYETRLAELESAAPPQTIGRSAARNHDMMLDEVKRACISVLSEQHFDLFSALNEGALRLPEIDFAQARAEGAYARFFEQAFEWQNVAWVPYSYFWGRKSKWLDKLTLTEGDAEFEAFLKAGYLRVVIPVRLGWEAAVDHFRQFGEPWFGGPLPTISDPTYLPVADEIAERTDRPGGETPQGDPWPVQVPTELLALRTNPGLPSWTQQPDGSWLQN
jgi:hypothetical protein